LTTLVIGGTGSLGKYILDRLASETAPIRCIVRVSNSIEKLPDYVHGYVGDLSKPITLAAAFNNVEKLFLLTPLHGSETQYGLTAINAAKAAKVKKIVYLSVPINEHSQHIPHYKSKQPIEEAILKSGIDYTLLRPNNLFQNDFWVRAGILAYNTYPQPIGTIGLNRVDARDVADAIFNALTQPTHANKDYILHGPDILTGDTIAQRFSQHLNRTIYYGGDDLKAWGKQAQHMMPAWMVTMLHEMYQYFQQHGQIATDEELAYQDSIIGHPARDYDAFLEEIIPEWQNAPD